MKCLKKEVNDMDDKWFGTLEYRIAADALSRIAENLENPTYAQVVQVLEACGIWQVSSVFLQRYDERGENMGRFAENIGATSPAQSGRSSKPAIRLNVDPVFGKFFLKGFMVALREA